MEPFTFHPRPVTLQRLPPSTQGFVLKTEPLQSNPIFLGVTVSSPAPLPATHRTPLRPVYFLHSSRSGLVKPRISTSLSSWSKPSRSHLPEHMRSSGPRRAVWLQCLGPPGPASCDGAHCCPPASCAPQLPLLCSLCPVCPPPWNAVSPSGYSFRKASPSFHTRPVRARAVFVVCSSLRHGC